MKKVLIAILAVVALASCQQEDAPQGVKYPILFGSTDTRAVADLDDLKDSGFKVYAYFQGTAEGTGSYTFEKTVTYYEDDNVWAYEGLEYWIPGVSYWFKAFYPAQLTAGTLAVNNGSSAQSFTITNFDITKQEDIMVASATASVEADASAPKDGSVVDLNFQHLLACVVVKIKAEVNVTINDVSLKYVPVNGSYADGLWSYSSQGNIEKDGLNKSLSSSSEEYHDVTDGGFLVFPCDINETKLYIKTSDKTYELPLTAPTSWVAGNRYTYTLTIKQNDILFDEPTVEEWDEENAVGSVIIK
jgi:hypothetical protein